MRRIVDADDAPTPMGAYSQATETDGLVFTAGQLAVTPAGVATGDVPKTTVYLDDIDAMNEAYEALFEGDPPVRSAIAGDALYGGAGVEIEAAATKR